MKTGRVRRKAQPEPEPERPVPEPADPVPEPEPVPPAPEPEPAPPGPKPKKPRKAKPRRKRPAAKPADAEPKPRRWAGKAPPIGCIVAPFVLFVIAIVIIILLSGGKKADQWIPVTRATGEWTTTVTLLGPQVRADERWEADCIQDPNGVVRAGSCVAKDAKTYQDKIVDDYDEYAYNIYYEESWQQVYQAQGAQFVETSLGRDDWWEGNLHYTLVEELDKDSCEYTSYTVWVDDTQDKTQEVEVYLAECEVWDHVVVEERIYDQAYWCLCDVTTMIELGQQSERGTGFNIRWPNPNAPRGGTTDPTFRGQVTFVGDDYTYVATTDDLDRYQDYLRRQHYIGIRDGNPVAISRNPKD